MRSINKIAARALRPTIVVVTCLVIAGGAVIRVVQSVRTTPHVGDILAFVPSPVVSADDDARLLVHRQNQFGCVLDLSVLRHSGGSLIVETEIDGGGSNFRVHWAGQRTSCQRRRQIVPDSGVKVYRSG